MARAHVLSPLSPPWRAVTSSLEIDGTWWCSEVRVEVKLIIPPTPLRECVRRT